MIPRKPFPLRKFFTVCTRSRRASAVAPLLAIALVPPACAAGLSLDGPWHLKLDPQNVGLQENWADPATSSTTWHSAPVPGRLPDDYDGVAWYRRTVVLPPSMKGATREGRVKVVFTQVDDHARVYINGQLAAENSSYNMPFFADLPPSLAGETSANDAPTTFDLTVRVDDLGIHGGILQSVALREVSDERELYRTPLSDRRSPTPLRKIGKTVFYSVYVRNFTPEGTFDALRERLPELKSLGVNTLWLLPIHPIGEVERKGPDGSPYAIRDYYGIDPALGTKEDFRELVKAVHDHGMRIIIDCVLNHTSPDSVLAAEHPDWFRLNADGKPTARNPEWSDIVDLNWEKKEVWNYCFGFLEYWVREFDIDGYRADVADLMPGMFWQELRTRLEAIKPGRILMLAESEDPKQLLQGFDVIYNQNIRDAAIAVAGGRQPAAALKKALYSTLHGAPEEAAWILFTENHDKERAMNEYGSPERARAGAALVCTLPGLPLLYTGTEVGASSRRDDEFFTRTPVDLSRDPAGMRSLWRSLLHQRAAHPALQHGETRVLQAGPEESVFAFERVGEDERVVVVFNLGTETVTVSAPEEPAIDGLELKPWSWKVIPRKVPG